MEKREIFFRQIIKYGLVGVLNTLLTALVIWIVLFLFSTKSSDEPYSAFVMTVANMSGYLVGIINSFILNRNWTFKNKSNWKHSFIRFLIAFIICYGVQLAIVLWLSELSVASAYACQLIGIIVYSILNFLLNKYFTFI